MIYNDMGKRLYISVGQMVFHGKISVNFLHWSLSKLFVRASRLEAINVKLSMNLDSLNTFIHSPCFKYE